MTKFPPVTLYSVIDLTTSLMNDHLDRLTSLMNDYLVGRIARMAIEEGEDEKAEARVVGSTKILLTALQKPFPFLQLPRELRDKVYDLVFGDTTQVNILDNHSCRIVDISYSPPEGRILEGIAGSSLLHTCRQIHVEAAAALYSSIEVHAGDGVSRMSCYRTVHFQVSKSKRSKRVGKRGRR